MNDGSKAFLFFILMFFIFLLILALLNLYTKNIQYTIPNPEIITFKTECFRSKGKYEQLYIDNDILGVRCYDMNGHIVKQKEVEPYVTEKK